MSLEHNSGMTFRVFELDTQSPSIGNYYHNNVVINNKLKSIKAPNILINLFSVSNYILTITNNY